MTAPDNDLDLTRRTSFVVALGALVSVSAISMDVMLPAIPVFAGELRTDAGTAQLAVTLYFAGFAAGQVPSGLATDRWGRRPLAFIGLVVFIAGGTAAALADSIEVLLAARFLQGIGASTTPVVSRAIVRDVASGAEAGKLMSLMVSIITLAPLLAPSVGSALLAVANWRFTFGFGTAAGVLALVLVWRHVPETGHRHRGQGRSVAASLRAMFVSRSCLVGGALASLGSASYMAVLTSSSAIFEDVYQVPPTWFGPVFAIAAAAVTAGALVSRRYVGQVGVDGMIRAGALITAAGATALAAVTLLGAAPLWIFWGAVTVFMAGGGMLLPNAVTLALEGIPGSAGFAASILGTVQLTAGAASSALAAALYAGGIGVLTAIMTVCSAIAAALALVAHGRGWMAPATDT